MNPFLPFLNRSLPEEKNLFSFGSLRRFPDSHKELRSFPPRIRSPIFWSAEYSESKGKHSIAKWKFLIECDSDCSGNSGGIVAESAVANL
uniref:Uncharacterized protein n=1 Tax=Leptospira ellisii TaxID=2023197 RepID=A0A2N0B599_9LEPT|nr:hypothetical protein CH379_17340 [Leptospira ellisii]